MFNIGQKVVCIKNHSQRAVVKGQIYTIRKIGTVCNCNDICVDIGLVVNTYSSCDTCGYTYGNTGDTWWLASDLFAPIEEISNTTFDEIMESITLNNISKMTFEQIKEKFDIGWQWNL